MKTAATLSVSGMFDFQVVEDVNMAIDVLSNLKNRKRPWYA